VAPEWVAKPGVEYVRADDMAAIKVRGDLVQFLQPLFSR
jgi:hypothetical protein